MTESCLSHTTIGRHNIYAVAKLIPKEPFTYKDLKTDIHPGFLTALRLAGYLEKHKRVKIGRQNVWQWRATDAFFRRFCEP